jgi:hypothetical protein
MANADVSESIRRYAAMMGANEFSVSDVLARLPASCPRSTVRSALARLAAKGELKSRPCGNGSNLYCEHDAQPKLFALPALPKQLDIERAFYRMVRASNATG